MILILFIFIGLFLSIFSFFLLKKQTIFLTLLADSSKENQKFLTVYGLIFLTLAFLAFVLSAFIQKDRALFFIAAMMVISGLFSYQFSKKIR